MTRHETEDMNELYCISPALLCSCDELYVCQSCYEQGKEEEQQEQLTEIINFLKEDHGT
tara:strand:- start:767 stop:943 length:177 start_codon:yes stop_codon:yes gene_type:complete